MTSITMIQHNNSPDTVHDDHEKKNIFPSRKKKSKLLHDGKKKNENVEEPTSDDNSTAKTNGAVGDAVVHQNDNNGKAHRGNFLRNTMSKTRTGGTPGGTATSGTAASDGKKKSGTKAMRGLRGVGGKIKRSFSKKIMLQQLFQDAFTNNEEILKGTITTAPPTVPSTPAFPDTSSPSSCSMRRSLSPKISSKTRSSKEESSMNKRLTRSSSPSSRISRHTKKKSLSPHRSTTSSTKKGTKKSNKTEDDHRMDTKNKEGGMAEPISSKTTKDVNSKKKLTSTSSHGTKKKKKKASPSPPRSTTSSNKNKKKSDEAPVVGSHSDTKNKDATIEQRTTSRVQQEQRSKVEEKEEVLSSTSATSLSSSVVAALSSPSLQQPSRPQGNYNTVHSKLEQANDRMNKMMIEQGEEVFGSEDFLNLLEEREGYMEELAKASDVELQMKGTTAASVNATRVPAPPPPSTCEALGDKFAFVDAGSSSTTKFRSPSYGANHDEDGRRRRSLGPKRRSHKVSAPRLFELEDVYVPKTFEKTPEDLELLHSSLAKNFLFKRLTDKALEQIIQAFEPQDHFKRGDTIMQQSEEFGEHFYILGSGSVVFEDNGKVVGSTSVPGAPFGELALLYQSARTLTVRSDSDKIRLYRVDQITFRYILQSRSKFKAMGMQAVTKVKAVNRLLGKVGLKAIKMVMDNDYDEDDEEEGTNSKLVGEFGNGEKQVDALSTLDISTRSKLSISSRRGFEHDDNAEQDFLCHSERRMSVRSSMMSISSVSVNSFQRNSVLGEGQFGEVWLVQPNIDAIAEIHDDIDDLDEEKFALKIQSKDCMNHASTDYSVEDAVKRECDVLKSLCHPFIVDFVRSFEDEENIYMVMGAIHGKELWEYIHREQDDGEWVSGIPEEHAKFYGIVISDTLNFMHRQLICHRDIKPENIMINQNGYPVLVDFGFAKQLPENDTTYTLCGTPKYTAPEVIANEGHGCAVDNWALGVVLYEMISGENPFWYDGIGDLQLLEDICNEKPYPIQDDADCTELCQDLISKLLEKDPIKRLIGAEITSHSWFDGIDLSLARKMELPAPWIPPPE